jgi:hypothetical protein
VYQLLGKKYPPGLSYRDGGSAKMLPKQTSELTFANSETCRQGLDVRVIEAPRLDQLECSGYRVGAATPEGKLGRYLRPTAQTGAKPSCLCRRSRMKEADVF